MATPAEGTQPLPADWIEEVTQIVVNCSISPIIGSASSFKDGPGDRAAA